VPDAQLAEAEIARPAGGLLSSACTGLRGHGFSFSDSLAPRAPFRHNCSQIISEVFRVRKPREIREKDPHPSDPLRSVGLSYKRWRESSLKIVLRRSRLVGFATLVFSVVDSVRNGQFLLIGIYLAIGAAILIGVSPFLREFQKDQER